MAIIREKRSAYLEVTFDSGVVTDAQLQEFFSVQQGVQQQGQTEKLS
jgi:hypothetical protein